MCCAAAKKHQAVFVVNDYSALEDNAAVRALETNIFCLAIEQVEHEP